MKKFQPYICAVATVIIGLLFVVSAVMKMKSIDAFELYIFSFEIVSLNVAALLARVIVGVELSLGLGYICNIYHKQFFYTILASLVGFTLFLGVAMLLGREDNCHCFGDLVDISPAESILKNIAMIVALLLSYRLPEWRFSWAREAQSYVLIALCAIAFYPAFKYPHRALFAKQQGTKIDVELFNEFIDKNPQYKWGDETKIVFFYGTSCKYCKYSAKQLSQIVRRNNLSTNQIKLVFWGTKESVIDFYTETNSMFFDFNIIDPRTLLAITNGRIPTMVFYDKESKAGLTTKNTKNLNESDIINQLK